MKLVRFKHQITRFSNTVFALALFFSLLSVSAVTSAKPNSTTELRLVASYNSVKMENDKYVTFVDKENLPKRWGKDSNTYDQIYIFDPNKSLQDHKWQLSVKIKDAQGVENITYLTHWNAQFDDETGMIPLLKFYKIVPPNGFLHRAPYTVIFLLKMKNGTKLTSQLHIFEPD